MVRNRGVMRCPMPAHPKFNESPPALAQAAFAQQKRSANAGFLDDQKGGSDDPWKSRSNIVVLNFASSILVFCSRHKATEMLRLNPYSSKKSMHEFTNNQTGYK